jgi:meso-butanediol dehydrogenase / (S,S)-butanediol dehydrogenase / diacetyl reductase
MKLKQKVALVTGGGRGIGRGIVLSLADEGADVAVADRNFDDARKVALEVETIGRRSLPVAVDVVDETQVNAMVEQTIQVLGRLDIVVNAAGVITVGPIGDLTVESWDFVMDVNAKGTFLVDRAAIKAMRRQGGGSVINVASVAGKEGAANLSHYCASKYAVVGLTNSLAKEVARENITVNAICPGIVGTYMWDLLSDYLKNPGESVQDSWARLQQELIPQGRGQTPGDMGQLAVFLATMPNLTGQSVNVDGGMVSH